MEEAPAHTLRITTWNVLNQGYECEERYDEAAHPHLHWDQGRGERACAYLKRLDSDIYCLQEVNHAMARQIQVALDGGDGGEQAYELYWLPRTEAHAKTEDGLATLYRKDRLVLRKRFCGRYPSGKHIYTACHFACIDNDVVVEFWCINTHVNWETREGDLLALQRELTENPHFTHPFHKSATGAAKLAMGDFNAERTEEWHKQLGAHGLVDALAGTIYPYSYNSGKLAKWIDYVLLHRLERVQRVIVGGDANGEPDFKDRALPSADVPSDHLPITVVVETRTLRSQQQQQQQQSDVKNETHVVQ